MRQEDLIGRAREVLSEDARVLAVFLAGSLARGTSDRYSDVDLLLVVAPGDVDGFIRDWPALSDQIAPAVLRVQVGSRPMFTQVTAGWLRFDVSVGTPADLAGRTRSTLKPLYDPHDLGAGLAAEGPARQPDPRHVETLVREFLRVLGLLPVVVGRSEFVAGESGAGLLRTMLIQLMLEDVAVEDRGGALHLNTLLPEDRLRVLTDLPAMTATRESVTAAHVACAEAFLPIARELYARCGLDWPAELEDAVRGHLSAEIAVDLAT
jgi:predicted nucleotidyltransferase